MEFSLGNFKITCFACPFQVEGVIIIKNIKYNFYFRSREAHTSFLADELLDFSHIFSLKKYKFDIEDDNIDVSDIDEMIDFLKLHIS